MAVLQLYPSQSINKYHPSDVCLGKLFLFHSVNTRSYQRALYMFLSLSVYLSFSPFLHSLRGNLLGIAPLLSSPLPGCCCRLYSVTTVCTQPGAPSNATSRIHSTWRSECPALLCVCMLNTHTHLMFTIALLPLSYLCLY